LKDPRKKRKRRKRKRSEVTGSAAAAEAVILNWRTYKRKDKKTRERLASTAGSAKAGLPRLASTAGSAKAGLPRLAGTAGSVKALRSALDKKEPKGLFFTA